MPLLENFQYLKHKVGVLFILTLWMPEYNFFKLITGLYTCNIVTEFELSFLWWHIWVVLFFLERFCQSPFLKKKKKKKKFHVCFISIVSSFRASSPRHTS